MKNSRFRHRRWPIFAIVIGSLGSPLFSGPGLAQSPAQGDSERDATTPSAGTDLRRILNQAFQAASQIDQTSEKALVLAKIARTLAVLGDRENALTTLTQAVDQADAVADSAQRIPLLCFDAQVLQELGARNGVKAMTHRASQLARSLTDRESKVVALTACAHAMAEVGDPASSLEIFREAVTIAKSIGDEVQRNSALSRLADDQARLGDLDSAFRTIAEIVEGGGSIRPSFLEALINALKKKEPNSVRAVLNDATSSTSKASKPVLMLYAGRADSGHLKHLDRAIEIFDELDRSIRLPSVYRRRSPTDRYAYRDSGVRLLVAVAIAQAAMGKGETAATTSRKALQFAEGLQPHDRIECNALIARALAKAGVFEEALGIARTLATIEADPKERPLPPTDVGFVWRERALCLIDVAEALFAAGRDAAAQNLLREAACPDGRKDDRDQVDVLLALATAQVKRGDRPEGLRNWTRAIRYLKSPEGWSSLAKVPPEEALSRFALEQARAGDGEWAIRTTLAIKGDRLGWSPQGETLAEIAVIQATSGDLEGAQRTAYLIPKEGGLAAIAAWEEIAKTRSKSGDTNRTVDWAAGLTPVSFKASALLGVAEGVLARGAVQSAEPAQEPEGKVGLDGRRGVSR